MKLIVDAQLPPALAAALREIGMDAIAVRDIGLRGAKDSAIWHHAVENGASIITKDEDFAQRCQVGRDVPIIIGLRIGNATNPGLLKWLLPRWSLVEASLSRGLDSFGGPQSSTLTCSV